MAACAAEQGRFWQADRYLFAYADPRKGVEIDAFAKAVKIERARLDHCLTASTTYEKAERSNLLARQKHVRETPGYLVDGKKVAIGELEQKIR